MMKMKLKAGYKQTEVGVIPNDWEVLPLDSVFNFYSTSNYSKAEMFLNGDIGCIHYGLIHAIPNSSYNLQNGIKYFVTREQAKYEIIKDGDVIMVDASEDLISVNKSVELSGIGSKKYIAGLHTFLLRDNNSVLVNGYRGAILNSKLIKSQLVRLAVGMKVFGVSKTQLKTVQIPVPTKAEQTAIANALNDADALISSLEKLIEKKRNIKQGAMQQLLKPKNGSVIKSLGEVIIKKQKTSHQSSFGLQSGNFPFFTNSSNDKIEKYFNDYDFDDEVIIANTGGVSHFKYFNGKFASMSDCFVFTSKEKVKFLFYFLKSIEGFINDNYFTGSGIKHLDKKYFSEIKLSLPNIDEQNEIVEILSDMDNEITSLEKKLSKSKMLKQGMMQELLTGKIRLV